MDLSRLLCPATLLLNIDAADKEALIARMVQAVIANRPWPDGKTPQCEAIEHAIRDRESTATTYIGDQIAFPHARIDDLTEVNACIAILNTPIVWNDEPSQLADIICLYLVPTQEPTVGIRFMGAAAELFSDPHSRTTIRQAPSADAAIEFIHKKQLMMTGPILARDIMQPEPANVRPATPLADVTHTMLHRHTEALPVCDENGCVLGEITCDLLFRRGIPDFFMQLASVSFIRNYDPFENYFAEEAHSVAGDIMTSPAPCVSPDTTIMELLFLLTARDHKRLFVVDSSEGASRLVGAVDRITVLDRVIHQ